MVEKLGLGLGVKVEWSGVDDGDVGIGDIYSSPL